MPTTKAYAAFDAASPLRPHEVSRRTPKPHDVVLEIDWCGICHTDLHHVKNDWGSARYPIVPGHEIVGRVVAVGTEVKHTKVGALGAIGCMVDSCRVCDPCKRGLEQYCDEGMTPTYNGMERDGSGPTYGGYSRQIVVDEAYVVRVAEQPNLEAVAPLLCAGITTYSPLRHWKVGKGTKVGVVGLGGLGHIAVKIARAMGAEVTLFSTSSRKREDAKRLGAHAFVDTSEKGALAKMRGQLDFVLDTVSAEHDVNDLLRTLRIDGTFCLVGLPAKPLVVRAWSVVGNRRSLSGSGIGGMAETQEMLDFCAEHRVTADVEVVPIQKINEAYERLQKGDVRYRFVIDNRTLG